MTEPRNRHESDPAPDPQPDPVPGDTTAEGETVGAEPPEVDAAAPADADGPAPADGEQPVPDDLAATLDQVRAELEEAERLRDEYLDHLLRARAEFDNFRKRVTRERMDALDRGAEQLAAQLLGVLDHLGFALDAADKSEDDQLAKGVRMVHTEVVDVLRQAGLEEVPGVGRVFDPTMHEAMMQVEADEPLDEPVVTEVLRPGYRFKGRVLRPASVKVAR